MPPVGGWSKVMAMLTRRSLLALPLMAACALPAVASASYHEARFLAHFDGTVHTVWNFPKTQMHQDCYRTEFYEGHGEETWHVHSKSTKVLMVGNSAATQFLLGTWTATGSDVGGEGMKAKGEVTRSRTDTHTTGAGTCGVTQPYPDEPQEKDCGTRLVNYEIQLSATGRAVAITPDVLADGQNGIREKTGFDHCGLVTPDSVLAGSWPAASGRLMAKGRPVGGWFGRHGTLTATGKDSWDAKEPVGGGDRTATTSIEWKLTFTRVGKTRGR
jgi:hypothetical protein